MSGNDQDHVITYEEIPWLEHEVHIEKSRRSMIGETKKKNNDEQNEDGWDNDGDEVVNDDDDDDEGYVRNFVFHMFDKPSDVIYNTYEFDGLIIRGQEELGNSTGLSVCHGSVVLYNFLRTVSTRGRSSDCDSDDGIDLRGFFEGKVVVELGAGTGLCGLCASKHLGATTVVMTDGDTSVLKNMRYNVNQNSEPGTENQSGRSEIGRVHCEQLIWGDQVQCRRLVERHGRPNIILAADCLYMSPAVKPFFDTIDGLFRSNKSEQNNYTAADGLLPPQQQQQQQQDRELQILIYVLVSASQVPQKMISDEAERVGFSCSMIDKDVYCYSRWSTVAQRGKCHR